MSNDIGSPQTGELKSTRRGLNVEADSRFSAIYKKGGAPLFWGDVLEIEAGDTEVVVVSGTDYDYANVVFTGIDGASGTLNYDDVEKVVTIAGSAGSRYNVQVIYGTSLDYYKKKSATRPNNMPSLP